MSFKINKASSKITTYAKDSTGKTQTDLATGAAPVLALADPVIKALLKNILSGVKDNNLSDASITALENRHVSKAFEDLYKRGVNPLRVETLLVNELIPIATGETSTDSPESASTNLNYGEAASLKVNQVMRLIDLQRIIRKNILKVSGDFLEEYLDISNGNQERIISFFHKIIKNNNEEFLVLGSDTEAMVTLLIDLALNPAAGEMPFTSVRLRVEAEGAARRGRGTFTTYSAGPSRMIEGIKESDKSEFLRSIARYVILDYVAQNSIAFITRLYDLKDLLRESISIAQTELPPAENNSETSTSSASTPYGTISQVQISGANRAFLRDIGGIFGSSSTTSASGPGIWVTEPDTDRIANANKLLRHWGMPDNTSADGFSGSSSKHMLTRVINANVSVDKTEEVFGSNKHMYTNLFANLLRSMTFMQTLSEEQPKHIQKSRIAFTAGSKNLAKGLNILKSITPRSMASDLSVFNPPTNNQKLNANKLDAMLSAVSEDKDAALVELVAAVCYDQVAGSNIIGGIDKLLAQTEYENHPGFENIENLTLEYFNKMFFDTGIATWDELSAESLNSFDYSVIAKNDNKLGSYMKSRFSPKHDEGTTYIPSEHTYEDNVYRADTFLNSPDYFFNKAIESEDLKFDEMTAESKQILRDIDVIVHDVSTIMGLDFKSDGSPDVSGINGFADDNSPLSYFYGMCDILGREARRNAGSLGSCGDLAVPLIHAGSFQDLEFTADAIKGSFFASVGNETNNNLMFHPDDPYVPKGNHKKLLESAYQESYLAFLSEKAYYIEGLWISIFTAAARILKGKSANNLLIKDVKYPANTAETYESIIWNGSTQDGVAKFNDSTYKDENDNTKHTTESYKFGTKGFKTKSHPDYVYDRIDEDETDQELGERLNIEAGESLKEWLIGIAIAIGVIAIIIFGGTFLLLSNIGTMTAMIFWGVLVNPFTATGIAVAASIMIGVWAKTEFFYMPDKDGRPSGIGFSKSGLFESALLTNAALVPPSIRNIANTDEVEASKKLQSTLFGINPNFMLNGKPGNGSHKEWTLAGIVDVLVEFLQDAKAALLNFFGVESEGDNDGTIDDDDYYKPYFFTWNEKAGEYGGIFKTNTASRYTLFTLFFARVLYKSVAIVYEGKESHLRMRYFPTHWLAMADALQRKDKDPDFSSNGKYAELKSIYDSSYNSAASMVQKVSACMQWRRAAILRNLQYLKQNSNEIREAVRRSEAVLKGSAAEIPTGEKIALKYLQKIGFVKAGLTFLSDGTAGTLLKNYQKNYLLDFRSDDDESSNPEGISVYPYFKLESYDLRDLKIMAKLFSKKGRGLTSHVDDALGRKNIMHIGIPVGMVRALQNEAYNKTGEIEYYYSNNIAIHITKINGLDPQIKYQARTYVFNMSKHIASLKTGDSYKYIAPPGEYTVGNHLKNYNDDWTIDEIKENIEILTATRWAPVYYTGVAGIQTTGESVYHLDTTYDDEVYEAMLENHVYDHYSKLYTYSTTGIDMSETMFPLDRELIFEGKVDQAASEAYNLTADELTNRYPSSNIVPAEAQEYYRVMKTLRSSLYFSAEARLESCLATQCFQRIFSIPMSERDFVLKISEYNMEASDVYKAESMPRLELSCRNTVSQHSIAKVTGVDEESKTPSYNEMFKHSPAKVVLEYQKGLNEKKTDVSSFVVEVAILKSSNLE